MTNALSFRLALAGAALSVLACARASVPATQGASSTSAPTGTYSLQSLSAWRGYKEMSIPKGWIVVDNTITKEGEAEDLVSRQQYANFELSVDWKLASGGNAGIFYRGTEEYDHIYWSAPEYQLLDDPNHPDGKNRLTSAASAYGLYAPPAGIVKPAGQWNTTKIVARGNHIEHWLNGQKVVEYEFGSPDWEKRLKASKFATAPKYGRLARGHIGIQGDHEGALAIRDMRIRVLP